MEKGLRNKIWWAKERQLMRHRNECKLMDDKEQRLIEKMDLTNGFLDKSLKNELFNKCQELSSLKVFIDNLNAEYDYRK